jgi:uncharacterized membrane protein
MTKQQKQLQISLWVAQAILAISFIIGAGMKLFMSVDALSNIWPWAGQISKSLVRFTGVVDLLAAVGLTAPAFLKIHAKIVTATAIGIIVLMVCASVFHIVRGEVSQIGVNIVFMFIAAFIVWGRAKTGSPN